MRFCTKICASLHCFMRWLYFDLCAGHARKYALGIFMQAGVIHRYRTGQFLVDKRGVFRQFACTLLCVEQAHLQRLPSSRGNRLFLKRILKNLFYDDQRFRYWRFGIMENKAFATLLDAGCRVRDAGDHHVLREIDLEVAIDLIGSEHFIKGLPLQ